jgi:hypothetical protein
MPNAFAALYDAGVKVTGGACSIEAGVIGSPGRPRMPPRPPARRSHRAVRLLGPGGRRRHPPPRPGRATRRHGRAARGHMSSPATIRDTTARGTDPKPVARMISGRLVDLEHPDPASIRVEDLAHALARISRFAGNINGWWSVADHALLCRELICEAGASELALAALHHDSHEAITGDLITPVRALLDPARVRALTRPPRRGARHRARPRRRPAPPPARA